MQNYNATEKINFSNLMRKQRGELVAAYVKKFEVSQRQFYTRLNDLEFTKQEKDFFRAWITGKGIEWIELIATDAA